MNGTLPFLHAERRGGQRAMPVFLVVSLTLHAVLLSQHVTQHENPAPGRHDSPMSVKLHYSTPATTPARMTAQQTSAPAALTAHPAAHVPATAATVTDRNMANALSAPERGALVPATDTAVPSAPVPATSLRSRVGLALAHHFYYPAIAQRRGQQGIVLLAFRITVAGDIEAIHVAQSSGYTLLDRAAIGALRKVQKVLLDENELPQALDLQLPVIYRLENS